MKKAGCLFFFGWVEKKQMQKNVVIFMVTIQDRTRTWRKEWLKSNAIKVKKMEKRISGLHHTALRPTKENYDKTVHFYTDLLGFTLDKQWTGILNGKETECCMIDTGNGTLIEIFGNDKSDDLNPEAIPHVCYASDDVPGLMEDLAKAGYPPVDLRGNPIAVPYEDMVLSEDPCALPLSKDHAAS